MKGSSLVFCTPGVYHIFPTMPPDAMFHYLVFSGNVDAAFNPLCCAFLVCVSILHLKFRKTVADGYAVPATTSFTTQINCYKFRKTVAGQSA